MKTLITLMTLILMSSVCWAQEIKEPPVTVPNATKPVVDPVAQAIGLEPDKVAPHDESKDKPKIETELFPIAKVDYPATSWRGRGWNRGGGHGWWGDYHHASTAAEGYMSGAGRLYRGYGQYLQSRGLYMNLYQDARHKAIINHRDSVHTWWQLKDEYKERFKKEHPTFHEREEKRFDMALKVHAVKQKEKQLIAAGILPPKPASSFTFRGQIYKNYDEFMNSPGWVGMRLNTLYSAQQKEKRQMERDERFRAALQKFDESRKTLKGSTY